MPCELKQAASKSASQAEWHRIPLASDSKKAGKVDKSIGHLQMSAAMAVLNRGCGQPGQSLAVAVDLKRRLSELNHEELLRLRETYMAAVGPEPIKLIEHNENQSDSTRPWGDFNGRL